MPFICPHEHKGPCPERAMWWSPSQVREVMRRRGVTEQAIFDTDVYGVWADINAQPEGRWMKPDARVPFPDYLVAGLLDLIPDGFAPYCSWCNSIEWREVSPAEYDALPIKPEQARWRHGDWYGGNGDNPDE